jgi:hypothetical protein
MRASVISFTCVSDFPNQDHATEYSYQGNCVEGCHVRLGLFSNPF